MTRCARDRSAYERRPLSRKRQFTPRGFPHHVSDRNLSVSEEAQSVGFQREEGRP